MAGVLDMDSEKNNFGVPPLTVHLQYYSLRREIRPALILRLHNDYSRGGTFNETQIQRLISLAAMQLASSGI